MLMAAMLIDPSRVRGGLLGLAVGDALGWPIEDRGGRVGGTAKVVPEWRLTDWRRREGGSYSPHEQPVAAGAFSDDTQLTLAVARSVECGEVWWDDFTGLELPLWTVYERGGGGATKRAAQSWLRGRSPWSESQRGDAISRYFAAGGNGTAMRCLPHCVVADDPDALARRLDLDAIATHGHPRALLGSRVFGWAVWWGLRRRQSLRYGELIARVIEAAPEWAARPELPANWREAEARHAVAFDDEWQKTVDEVLDLLATAKRGIDDGALAVDGPVLDRLGVFGGHKGAGTVTAVAAVFLATRYVSQPQQAMLAAAFARGADTDTLAAMTGALLGALNGEDWLWPLAQHVQDAQYLQQCATILAGRSTTTAPRGRFDAAGRSALYRWLDEASIGSTAALASFGRIEITDVTDFDGRSQFVRSWSLRTEAGATFEVKRYDKGKDGRPRWNSTPAVSERAGEAPASDASQPVDAASRSPRAGLVLKVADLNRAARFYVDIVGLEIQRETSRYVSFGWLALEPDGRAGQLALDPGKPSADAVIRVYLVSEALSQVRTRVERLGLLSGDVEGAGFRAADLDGHAIEFMVLNGTAPPVQ
jgi:ADP-ribosylglycohydrolase/catechol 2,3-dioxygenase-like lactoylglutathione lyase family enzyme